MSPWLMSILSFSVAITLLVAVHEFGHYWVAKKAGIKVLRFSIGFGKPFWKKPVGPDRMELAFAAIPLGGYVKMLDEREGPVAEEERHRAFNRASVPARIAVLVAGPLANFLFAIAAYWLLFVIGMPGLKPVVGEVEPGSLVAEAGLRSGDRILTIGGRTAQTWDDSILMVLGDMLDDGVIDLTVEDFDRGDRRMVSVSVAGHEQALTEPGQLFTGLGFQPWRPSWPAVIEEVDAGGPAASAGLEAGDRVISAGGQEISEWMDLARLIQARPGELLELEVLRDGSVQSLSVLVAAVEQEGQETGRIGIRAVPPEQYPESMLAERRYGPIAALGVAAGKTWDMSVRTLQLLAKMLQGIVSPRNLSGPINIAQYAGMTASISFSAFLGFLAVVSISLGLINLMPIPILDGGQVVYQCIEWVKGKPLSERVQLIGQQIGIFLLVLLMTFAFYNDIARLID